MATGVVSLSSDLVRKKWMREGLLQAAAKSFWSPYTGSSMDSIVYQVNNQNAAAGHTVVFDFDGNLSGKAVKGKNTAFGKGEQKRKFSDKITVDRYRLVVDNGDEFDGVNVGDLSINQHSDSRTKLGDLFVRFKDQALFDAAQGFKDGGAAAASIRKVNNDFSSTAASYGDLVAIEQKLRTGTGYATGLPGATTAAGSRAPLAPYRMADGRSMWLVVVDPFTAAKLKSNASAGGLLQVMTDADVRGDNGRVFKGLLGRIGQLYFVEAEAFFGYSSGTALEDSEIEIAGMRQYDSVNTSWAGEASFSSAVYSRNLILGAGALQIAFGRMPDYRFQASQDFAIKSESAVEFWMETQKTVLTAENADYKQAKRANIDNGIVCWDVKVA